MVNCSLLKQDTTTREWLAKHGNAHDSVVLGGKLVYIKKFKSLKAMGYLLEIIYLDLQDSRLAIDRVKARVREGGHSIRHKKFEGDFLDQDKTFLTTTKILRTIGITSIIAAADLF